MPTTWCGRSFIRKIRPTTDGSPPRLRCQVLVAEHEHRGRARCVVGVHEGPSVQRPDTHDVEEACRHDARGHPLRFGTPQEDEPHVVEFDDAVEALRLPAVVQDLLVREAGIVDTREGSLLMEHDQPIAARVRQRTQQHTIHDAEDGGVGADAQRHRDDDHDCVAGVAPQVSRAVAHVVRHGLDNARQPGVPHVVLHLGHAAERAQRPPPRLLRREPRAHVLLGQHVDVKAQLLVEIRFHPIPVEQRRDSGPEAPEHVHPPIYVDSTRATAADSRSQFCVSSVSCFLPALVSW